MLFRILPVLVWSFSASLIGTALAVYQTHQINWIAFFLVLLTAMLIQGYPTHIFNEIMDWKSGADLVDLKSKKSGGSKVLQAGLLTIQDLWKAFFVSHVILLILITLSWKTINPQIVFYFLIPGYLAGLFYSLPPFRFAYRPFLGEWLGGFAGIFLLVLGSYYAQVYNINRVALINAFGMGLIYIGIMIFFHYLDYENDQKAQPRKNTTVVFLRPEGSRVYVYLCLLTACVIFLRNTLQLYPQEIVLLFFAALIFLCHYRINLNDPKSIIHWGKVITYASIVLAIAFAILANPQFFVMTIPAGMSILAYKKFGKLRGVILPE